MSRSTTSQRPASQKIGIDCRLAGTQHAGIGRYIQQLIRELLTAKTSVHWVLFFYDDSQAREVLGSAPTSSTTLVYAPIRHYTIEEQLRMSAIFAEHQLDLLHVPHFNVPLLYQGSLIVTIHDLLWHEYRGAHVTTLPAWQYALKHRAYRFVTGQAVKKAERILVPAHTVGVNIVKHYPEALGKILVTTEGVDKEFLSHPPSVSHRSQTLLYVGSLYPHKNIDVVLRSLAALPEYNLHIVGARNVFQDTVREQVHKMHLHKRVRFLGKLTDEELIDALDQAHALIQPSLHEGFGLTGIEAMARKTPVIASDIPIFQEIYQDAAEFFDPQDPASFVDAVHRSESPERSETLTQRGSTLARGYQWKKTALATLNAYAQILEQKSAAQS